MSEVLRRPGGRSTAWVLGASIALAAAVVYAPSLGGGFVFDDHALVEDSALLRGPLWPLWFSRDPVDYWPLTSTTMWVEQRLWGAEPLGYRIVNLLLHAGVAVLLWRVLERLRVPGAWLAGLIFAVHPVAVESTAWISERKNVLSGVLFLGAVLWWLRFRGTDRHRHAAAAAALFLGALLAKTSTVMLPAVLLGLPLLDGGRPSRRERRWLAGLFALAAAFGALTLWFQWTRSMGGIDLGRGVAERLGGAGWAWAAYLWTALQPFAAAVVYADWPVDPGSPWFWAPLAVLTLVGAAMWTLRARVRPVGLALAYHGIMVLPVLGLVDMAFLAFSPMGNHLQYLALMGPVSLVSAGLARAAAGRHGRWAIAAAGVVVLALGAHALRRSSAYVDDVALWSRAVREAPQSLTAARMLAGALADAGRPRDAVAALHGAAERLRDRAAGLRARALFLAQLDRAEEAYALEREATALRPDLNFQFELGVILNRGGRPDLSVPLLRDLVARQPRSATNRYQLGSALAKTHRLEEAAEELRVGCRLSPRHSDACAGLVVVLARQGRSGEAREAVAAAMGTTPWDPEVERILRAAMPGGSR